MQPQGYHRGNPPEVFLGKELQFAINLQENTHVEVLFQLKLHSNFIEITVQHGAQICCIFLKDVFLRTLVEGCFLILIGNNQCYLINYKSSANIFLAKRIFLKLKTNKDHQNY